MPRQVRIDAPGALQHIIIREIERKAIFKKDTDRDDFIDRSSVSRALGRVQADLALKNMIKALLYHLYPHARLNRLPQNKTTTKQRPLASIFLDIYFGFSKIFLGHNFYVRIPLCLNESRLLFSIKTALFSRTDRRRS